MSLFFFQASEQAGFLNPQIWLANHAHVTGSPFYDTAHGPDFSPLPKFRSSKLTVNYQSFAFFNTSIDD